MGSPVSVDWPKRVSFLYFENMVSFFSWKRLFADTLSVNKKIFADTLSANKKLFADT